MLTQETGEWGRKGERTTFWVGQHKIKTDRQKDVEKR